MTTATRTTVEETGMIALATAARIVIPVTIATGIICGGGVKTDRCRLQGNPGFRHAMIGQNMARSPG